jgi:hypothetical protein
MTCFTCLLQNSESENRGLLCQKSENNYSQKTGDSEVTKRMFHNSDSENGCFSQLRFRKLRVKKSQQETDVAVHMG